MVDCVNDLIECADCGAMSRETVDVDGARYCPDCFTVCPDCEKATRETVTDNDGVAYCEDCYNERYATCDGCNQETPVDEITSANGYSYCEDCYNERYTTCESCGDVIRRNDCYTSDDGEDYCPDCYHEHFFHCSDCGNEFPQDDCSTNSDGDEFCPDCYHGDEDCDGWDSGYFRPIGTYTELRSVRKFGVELETSSCDDYQDIQGETVFGCKEDGSITGKEFISPILYGDEGLDAIRAFCKLARGFDVDKNCGFHVHINVRDLTVSQLKAVAYAYHKTAEAWNSFVPSSRRTNYYCKRHSWKPENLARIETEEEWSNFISDSDDGAGDRYHWVNLASYRRHRTVEIRVHSATLAPDKICNWVKAHTRFVDAVKDMSNSMIDRKFGIRPETQRKGLYQVWGDESLAEFYHGRAAQFSLVSVEDN